MILPRPAPPSRITIVHRDAVRAETTARLLRPLGHRVELLLKGERLAHAVLDTGPDLLLVSSELPEPGPGPLVAAVRQVLPDLPVVVLSSLELAQSKYEADGIVREPLNPSELHIVVGGLLRVQGETRLLRQKVRELLGLYKITWGFSLVGGAEALFGHLAQHSAELLRAAKGVLITYDRERRQMQGRWRAFGLSQDQVAQLRYPNDPEARSRWDFRRNGPLLSNKAAGDSRLLPAVVAPLEARSVLIVPMTRGADVVGLLCVADKAEGEAFSDEDLNLLVAVAGEAAIAVENLHLHDEIKRANALLQEYDRLKSEFVAMVAHDFRKPLTAIRGFAELLLEEPEVPAETRQEYMKTIVSETDSLASLANDTLLITRIETGELEFHWDEIDLGPFVLNAVPLGLSNHSVLLDIPPGFPRVVADPERLRQVLGNLVSNALKYSPGGGSVTVRCRERGPSHVSIEVVDHGLGIPQEQVGLLFQKFQRVRHESHLKISGTGLGLYICRLIVEGHGGHIWVESELGKGSTFGVVLPLDARAAHEQRRHAKEKAAAAGAEASARGEERAPTDRSQG